MPGGPLRLCARTGARLALVLLLALACSSQAVAQVRRIGSCYDAIPQIGLAAPIPRRELYVLIDTTVLFDAQVRYDLIHRVEAFLSPGDRVVIATFSAYGSGQYTAIVTDGRLDIPLTEDERFTIGKFVLKRFDKCVDEQGMLLRASVARDIALAIARGNPKLPHSDIVASLGQFSPQLRANRRAAHFVVIVSDMLENSDVTSFYASGSLRPLVPAAELKKVRAAGLVEDLGGAAIFAEGPAFSLKSGYVGDIRFLALQEFWREYLAASRARLVDFGTPLLHNPIR